MATSYPDFNVEVNAWMSNCILQKMMCLITYPCPGSKIQYLNTSVPHVVLLQNADLFIIFTRDPFHLPHDPTPKCVTRQFAFVRKKYKHIWHEKMDCLWLRLCIDTDLVKSVTVALSPALSDLGYSVLLFWRDEPANDEEINGLPTCQFFSRIGWWL